MKKFIFCLLLVCFSGALTPSVPFTVVSGNPILRYQRNANIDAIFSFINSTEFDLAANNVTLNKINFNGKSVETKTIYGWELVETSQANTSDNIGFVLDQDALSINGNGESNGSIHIDLPDGCTFRRLRVEGAGVITEFITELQFTDSSKETYYNERYNYWYGHKHDDYQDRAESYCFGRLNDYWQCVDNYRNSKLDTFASKQANQDLEWRGDSFLLDEVIVAESKIDVQLITYRGKVIYDTRGGFDGLILNNSYTTNTEKDGGYTLYVSLSKDDYMAYTLYPKIYKIILEYEIQSDVGGN